MQREITLTPEQYDIAWADLGVGGHVHPLGVRSHGRMMSDREAIRQRVYRQLEARGLASGRRLDADLEDMFRLLANAPVWLTMSWMPDRASRDMHGAVAATAGESGVVAVLDAAGLRLRPVRGSGVIVALVSLLPTAEAGTGQPISVPRSALTSAGGRRDDESIYDSRPGDAGRHRQQIRAVQALFDKPRLRGGQILGHVRDRNGTVRESLPLEWFDTDGGRWMAQSLPGGQQDSHFVLAPADTARLSARLGEMLDGVLGR